MLITAIMMTADTGYSNYRVITSVRLLVFYGNLARAPGPTLTMSE